MRHVCGWAADLAFGRGIEDKTVFVNLEDDVLKILLWPLKAIGWVLPKVLMIFGVLAVIALAVGMLYR